jgi:hypothetical protein
MVVESHQKEFCITWVTEPNYKITIRKTILRVSNKLVLYEFITISYTFTIFISRERHHNSPHQNKEIRVQISCALDTRIK